MHIGKLTGNLLTGITVNDFVITDSVNQPFIAVARMRGDYGISDLLHKRVWIDNVVLERPLIVLDRRPSGDWNWKQIFPRDTTPKPASAQNGWTDRLRFTNVRIIGGNLVVRTPWRPSNRLSPAAADSAIRVALSNGSRQLIERVPDGFQKIIEMKAVNAFMPLVRLSEPGYTERVAQIASLTMEAYPFRPPAADVRGFQGTLPFTNDSVWWHGVTARLPNSVITGDGSYVFNNGDLTLRAHASPAAFADLRWLYPRMPSDAHGKLGFDLKWRDAVEDYRGYNMDIVASGARVLGSFGMTRGDSVTIHDTDLRFSGVDTRLVEQIVEGFKSPRRGTLSGRAKVHGGRNALVVDADVTFADQRAGTSRVVALGEVGFPGKGIRARDLRLRLLPVQVELVRGYAPNLPISGVVTGTATVNGNTASDLQIVADLDHADRGERSRVAGRATIRLAGTKRFDVDATAKPVSLVEVGRFAPSVGLARHRERADHGARLAGEHGRERQPPRQRRRNAVRARASRPHRHQAVRRRGRDAHAQRARDSGEGAGDVAVGARGGGRRGHRSGDDADVDRRRSLDVAVGQRRRRHRVGASDDRRRSGADRTVVRRGRARHGDGVRGHSEWRAAAPER